MSTITDLINKAKHELENTNSKSDMVGNRPHFPMLVVSNNMDSMQSKLYHIMERIWPQTASKVVFWGYEFNKNNVVDLKNNSAVIELECAQNMLDEIKMCRGVFAEMLLWCVYNIIDTSIINSLDEFKQYYELISTMEKVVVDKTRAMLVVLLDDSSAKRQFAKEIKHFLADEKNKYDGVFIVANRTQNSEMYSMDELYRIVSNILLLSNNDAVSLNDNEDYYARVGCFYNNQINTVSYSLLERPNRKIAMQILDTFLLQAKGSVENVSENTLHEWSKKLGISDKINVCEDFIKDINYEFNLESLRYLPMRKGEDIVSLSLDKISYTQFRTHSFEGMVEQFIDNYYQETLLPSLKINQCIEQFEQSVRENIPAQEISELSEEIVDNLFSKLMIGDVSQSLNVPNYIKEQMMYSIRRNILYPRCKEVLVRLKQEADATIKDFRTFTNEFTRSIPIEGFEKIGSMYKTIAENYVKTARGESDIRELLTARNGKSQFAGVLLQMLKNVIAENKSVFLLSFVEEWEQRLNLAGEVIFREIHNMLDENANAKIHLHGPFAIEEKLQIYMLHTIEAQLQVPTKLYNHLQLAYQGVPNVQFFNSGLEDSIEVMRVVDCSGDKLKL